MNLYNIQFQNGFYKNNDTIQSLPESIIWGSIKQTPNILSNYNFETPINLKTTPDSDGFFIFVPANTKPSKPIQITCMIDKSCAKSINLRNLFIIEAGSSMELIIAYKSYSGKPCICNDVTEIALGEAATLEFVRVQEINDTTRLTSVTTVNQAACSQMKTHYVNLSGSFIQNQLKVKLNDENAVHFAYGLSLTQQNEHVDNDIHIVHASPDCRSNQLFKHILSDTSTGVFTGRIVVDKGAKKTAAFQRSSNILLHPKAKMKIRPQLEIYADDVKCSHGATVGQLDAEALFYLRSRGVSEIEAKNVLLQAFANEIIDNISCEQFRNGLCEIGNGLLR